MEVPIKMTEELVQSTDYKKKKGKLYFKIIRVVVFGNSINPKL